MNAQNKSDSNFIDKFSFGSNGPHKHSSSNLVLIENVLKKHELTNEISKIDVKKISRAIVRRDSGLLRDRVIKQINLNSKNINLKDKEAQLFSNKLKESINKLFNDSFFVICMTIVTLYALLGSDISVAFLSKKYDYIFDILSTLALVLFFVELLLNIYADKQYIFSFFFWLDLVSTLSLIMEIDFIFSPILKSFG